MVRLAYLHRFADNLLGYRVSVLDAGQGVGQDDAGRGIGENGIQARLLGFELAEHLFELFGLVQGIQRGLFNHATRLFQLGSFPGD